MGAAPGSSGLLSGIVNGFSCHGDGHGHNASGSCHAASTLHPGVHSVDPTSFASFFPEVSADVHTHDQFLPDIGQANLADSSNADGVGSLMSKRRHTFTTAFEEKS